MGKLTVKGLAFIARREGLVTVPYQDGRYLAVGYGHNGPDVTAGCTVTPEEALALLRLDVVSVEKRLTKALTIILRPHRFDCLGSAAYNLGNRGIQPVVELVNQRKFKEAMDKLETFNKIRVGNNLEVSPGLTRRRSKERRIFEFEDYGELSPIPTWRGDPHTTPLEWTDFPLLTP